jgi:hypothetical protein
MIRCLQWKVNVEENSQLELKAKASIETQALSSLAFLYTAPSAVMVWPALPLSPYKTEQGAEITAWYVFEPESGATGIWTRSV